MPIQEEEKVFGKPASKARPTLKPSSTSCWDSIFTQPRKWIDIVIQQSKDPHCFLLLKCILDYVGTVNKLIDKKMVESIATKLLMNARRSYQTIQDIGQTKWRSNSPRLRIGELTNGCQFWQKVEDTKGFNIVRTRKIKNFLYLQAIQGYSASTINPALQNNLLWSEGFTEYIYHVGNGNELRLTVNHGLIPGGVSLKSCRHAVFCTVVNPMDNHSGLGEALCDLSWARIAPNKNTWIHFSGYSIWVQVEARVTKRKTRLNAVILYETLLAEFIEKAIMKTKDQLYQRESVIPRPRVVLRANSHNGSQDSLVQEARSSWESEQESESCGEARRNTADYQAPGISISTVKLQEARRQNNVTKPPNVRKT